MHDFVVYGHKLLFSSDSMTFLEQMYVYNWGDTIANPISKFTPSPLVFNPFGTIESDGKVYFNGTDPITGETEVYVFVDSVALNIKNVSFKAEVTVYPNPVQAQANMHLVLHEPAKLTTRLFDMTGKEVYSTGLKNYEAGTYDLAMPTQQLAVGNYIYAITNASGRLEYSGKLVKE